MGYIADYLMERVSMPDENGNLLQSDLTQPGVEVRYERGQYLSNRGRKLAQLDSGGLRCFFN